MARGRIAVGVLDREIDPGTKAVLRSRQSGIGVIQRARERSRIAARRGRLDPEDLGPGWTAHARDQRQRTFLIDHNRCASRSQRHGRCSAADVISRTRRPIADADDFGTVGAGAETELSRRGHDRNFVRFLQRRTAGIRRRRRVVVDVDDQRAIGRVAIAVGDAIGQRKLLIVLAVTRFMLQRRDLSHDISTRRSVQRDLDDRGRTLLDQERRAVRSEFIGETARIPGVEPGNRAAISTEVMAERTGRVRDDCVISRAVRRIASNTGIAADKRVIIELHDRVRGRSGRRFVLHPCPDDRIQHIAVAVLELNPCIDQDRLERRTVRGVVMVDRSMQRRRGVGTVQGDLDNEIAVDRTVNRRRIDHLEDDNFAARSQLRRRSRTGGKIEGDVAGQRAADVEFQVAGESSRTEAISAEADGRIRARGEVIVIGAGGRPDAGLQHRVLANAMAATKRRRVIVHDNRKAVRNRRAIAVVEVEREAQFDIIFIRRRMIDDIEKLKRVAAASLLVDLGDKNRAHADRQTIDADRNGTSADVANQAAAIRRNEDFDFLAARGACRSADVARVRSNADEGDRAFQIAAGIVVVRAPHDIERTGCRSGRINIACTAGDAAGKPGIRALIRTAIFVHACRSDRTDERNIVRPGDGDGDVSGINGAGAVGDRDGVSLGQRFAGIEMLNCGIVDREGPCNLAGAITGRVIADDRREGAEVTAARRRCAHRMRIGKIDIAERQRAACGMRAGALVGAAGCKLHDRSTAARAVDAEPVNGKPAADRNVREPAIAVSADIHADQVRSVGARLRPQHIA